jgi:IclR family transcriptional regulator, acetate operon repressor
VKNKPAYAIESVDHALHLAQLLQQQGPLRVTDAAELLGVSPSTAHRLLAMLVYRDFAEQGHDRRYHAGPVLRAVEPSEAPAVLLRRAALPHLQELVERVQESANVMVLVGDEIRFIATVECRQALRVGDRAGRVLPAHLASGGKALLASLDASAVEALYASRSDVDVARLRRELAAIRKRGYALNNQQTEAGLAAIGVALPDPDGQSSAAVSISMPAVRFNHDKLPTLVAALSTTAAKIEQALAADL